MEATLTKTVLNAPILRDLVAQAAKGSTNVDIIPLSCLMEVKVSNNVLTVRTTNNVNFVTMKAQVSASDIDIVVQTKLFAQIIGKLTTVDTITLSSDGSKVTIEAGKGKYNVPLALDTDGSSIQFPSVEYTPVGESKTLTNAQLRSILSISKACKAEMKEIPAIYNYYFDNNRVITSNVFKGCSNPISIFNTPVVLPPDLVELVSAVVNDDEVITVSQDENSVQFETTKGEVYGRKCTPADLEAFPAEQLVQAFNTEISNVAKINRSELAAAVDRISLFTDQLESYKVDFTFSKDGIHLYSSKTDSHEDVNYFVAPTTEFEPIVIPLDAKMLAQELAALDKEELTVKFDADTGVQFVVDGLVVMLSVIDVETAE